MDEQHDTVAKILQVLKRRIAKREWDMVAHLALQLKTYRHPRRIGEAIQALKHLIGRARRPKERAAFVRFAARALEYLPGSESDVRALVSSVYEEAISSGADRPDEAVEIIAAACQCARERREVATNEIAELLAQSITTGPAPQGLLACGILTQAGLGSDAIPESIQDLVLERVKPSIFERAKEDAFFARIFWEWYREEIEYLFRVHGLNIFSADRLPNFKHYRTGRWGYISSLQSMLLHGFVPSEATGQREALKAIGRHFFGSPKLRELGESRSMLGNTVYVPKSIWVTVCKNAMKADDDEMWGFIFCGIAVQELGMQLKHRGVVRRTVEFTRLPEFKRLSERARGRDRECSDRAQFVKRWLDGNETILETSKVAAD